MWAAWAGGVTSQIAVPQGTSLITGVSAAFYTQGTIAADALFKDQVPSNTYSISVLYVIYIRI